MSFEDPVIGGTVLRIPAIQSPNFSMSGQTGWAIFANGDAYFFNITAVGTITGGTLVIDGASGGVFVYSGTPAHGNLIASLTGAAGTDGFGNTYPAGLDVTQGSITGTTISGSVFNGTDFTIDTAGQFFYSGTPAAGNLILAIAPASGTDGHGNTYPDGLTLWDGSGNQVGNWATAGFTANNTQSSGRIQILPTNGTLRSPALTFQSGLTGISSTLPNINSNVNGTNPDQWDAFVLDGPITIGDTQASQVVMLLVGNVPPSVGTASGQMQYVNSTSRTVLAQWDEAGHHVYAGNVNGATPGTSNPPTPETWHTLTLSGNFTTNAQDQVPRYRFEGIGSVTGGICRLDGVAYTNAATLAANTTIGIVPVGYRPTQRKRFSGLNSLAGYAAGNASVQVTTAGIIQTGVISGATGEQICLDGITFPVD